ncbi:hypothetical protein ACJ41O_012547 [Fusarium nematophilum]
MPSLIDTSQATESPFTPKVMAKLAANAEKASRDFRSDVVTVPAEDMMKAILDASVRGDIYEEDGDASVKALEQKLV